MKKYLLILFITLSLLMNSQSDYYSNLEYSREGLDTLLSRDKDSIPGLVLVDKQKEFGQVVKVYRRRDEPVGQYYFMKIRLVRYYFIQNKLYKIGFVPANGLMFIHQYNFDYGLVCPEVNKKYNTWFWDNSSRFKLKTDVRIDMYNRSKYKAYIYFNNTTILFSI